MGEILVETSNQKGTHPIDLVFANKSKDLLNVYFTAGFPQLEDTTTILKALDRSGVDFVEIGMPFSDPIADGSTIQESNEVALTNGISISKLFDQLDTVKGSYQVPVILMGYMNPVLQYGIENFCKRCQQAGVSGLIIPDLPMYDYLRQYKQLFERYGLYNIFLISPQTSEARIREIDENSNGFIYMVSSASITGAKSAISTQQEAYFERINAMNLRNPRLIGFGISNNETYSKACAYAQGAIIGSAFIKALKGAEGSLEPVIQQFVNSIKNKAQ
ncbi:MAG: tryptophan synthase subunit alpha [Bacteroidota bacterium]